MRRSFTYDALPGRVVFGAGASRSALAAEVERLGATRVLVIAGEAEAALADALVTPLGDRVAGRFDRVRQHVPVEIAEAARARARDLGADLLLSIGGGSTTGTAKAVAMTTRLPILAVPTTYAGSEMTPVWGLTESIPAGTRKTTGTDPAVLPVVVVYDPELTHSLPVDLTVASGLNAMAHCVEAFWAPRANPVTDALAAEGIAALARGLPRLLGDGSDAEGRHDALYGAWLAGAAFAAAGSGLHHKICHVLGGAYDLPHAPTHAVVLPRVLAVNEPGAPEAAQRIRRALGSDGAPGSGAAGRLRDLERSLGAPASLAEVGLAVADLPAAVDLVTATVGGAALPDNPVPVDRDLVDRILRSAWEGSLP
ncbi:MAG: maleylacetate reductase [Kineosporiaceae bacterium]